jgi:signal transduction histidine kinase
VESNLPHIFADPIALRRILENLIANAADSLEANPGTVGVSAETVHGDDKHPWIRMVVADTGRGMTKEISGKIFNDFYTTKESGTGLGLSIVRRLVMDLHGSITVESEPEKGTRMIVDIPSNAPERI